MKLRSILLGIMSIGLMQNTAVAGGTELLQIRLHPEHPEIAVIKVDGRPDGGYDKVLTKTLKYDAYVRGDTPTHAVPGSSRLNLKLDGGDWISTTVSEAWKRYALTMQYRDPQQGSPIKVCNDHLQGLSGAARHAFLKNGQVFSHKEAYTALGQVGWRLEPGFHSANEWEQLKVSVKIECLGLNRDRNDGAGPSRTTDPLPPLFWKTTLKIEPAKMVRDGKYMCPSQLKLYGYVETGRKFQGKAIFMGPHYLSAVTTLHFSYPSSRNVVATYPVKWKQIGGLTTTSHPKPKRQTLTFRFNISGVDGKLLNSVEKTADVICRKIDVNGPDGITAGSAN